MLKGMSSSPIWEKIIENEEDAKKIEESFKRIDEYTKDFQLEIILRIERNTSELSNAVTQLQLESLPRARKALYNADVGDSNTLTREPCTPGTRIAILNRIYQWAQDSSPNSPRIFWLAGDAGSGKSTIACSVAGHFDIDETKSEAQNILRATFFCSRQFEETRKQKYIIPTIVYQLAHQSRSYKHALLRADKFGSVDVLSKQMKDLLIGPWQRSANDRRPELPPYLVVIDALDEIEGEGGPVFLRDLLMTVNSDQFQGLKFLITSRPHPDLASLCATFSSNAVCRLYEVPTDTVKADIVTYLKHKLPNLRDEPELTKLAQEADGLFIYAATVVRYITLRPKMAKGEQIDLMRKLFGSTGAMSSTTASLVDELYRQILREAFSNLEDKPFRTRLRILHTFLCTEDRVSPSIAAALSSDTGTEEQASIVVEELHAVLYVKEGCVFWYHASFQDFIFTETRSKFNISGEVVNMSCDVAAHNTILTRHCFRIMMSSLRFNICNLPSSFLLDSEVPGLVQLVRKNISDVLSYCCRYWSQYLARAASDDRDDLLRCIESFFPIHVLFWIEAMNLLGSSHECPSMLRQAHEWVSKGDKRPSDLAKDIAGTFDFAIYFTTSPAAQSTPHLYISSLMTWSRDSVISQTWKDRFSRAPSFTYTNVGNAMTVPLLTIQVKYRVVAAAFSTDGTRISVVPDSTPGSVIVCDAWTGKELNTLNGHTGVVTSVAFSSDGTRIVSGSNDQSVRVWDALMGEELNSLHGHTGRVKSVAFSTDGTRIVSGSIDESVRVWDAWTGEELMALNGHTNYVQSVAISSDGTRIISGSDDNSVRVWDASTGEELKTLNGHIDYVQSVAFSSDGTRIISGSNDRSVRVWDASTGKKLKTINGHTRYVRSVAFLSDGARIVSGSDDLSVRVWDARTGKELKRLNGHADYVKFVSSSNDGTRIVSGSDDGSVRVWDASTGKEPRALNGHTSYVTSIAFSTDGTRIASGSSDMPY
ncbi:hypothetical protein AX14_001956 [Amanita brunnescens Koide BX004]|nr:hypothetical protein AX14_001956 [Amanita brunnescens Koide BX004]